MIRFRSYFVLCFLALNFCAYSQSAPNFTVTDSWGNSHRLYEDYLDQGKTVVIKVFYVACPPCNAIAPFLEPLYQNWGGGQADVQFIELSILQSDTDAKINVYKNNHNTTFPAAGGQGGSVDAVAIYKSGTFGAYTGTPTFVVIAPDKSVNYDVYGSGISGTIAALDAAIAATGAEGINTATPDLNSQLPLSLVSNIVNTKLSLVYDGEPTTLQATILSLSGQVYTSARFPVEKNIPVNMDISALAEGSWILRVADTSRGIVASFLFVKI